MNQKVNVEKEEKENARENLKRQLEAHLAQQSVPVRIAHRWMTGLEIVGIAFIVAIFILALYLSINWKSINPMLIPMAWFAFAASIAPLLVFSGVDSIILRAFPTGLTPGGSKKFVTGSGAVWIGVGFIALAPVVVAFWGTFAYATWTMNFALLQPLISLLGAVMAAAIVIGMAQKTISKLIK